MTPSALFTKSVITADAHTTLRETASVMGEHNVGAVVITQQGVPVGIVTDRDIALAVCARGFTPDEPVQQVMTAPVETIDQGTGVFDAVQKLMALRVRRLPVVDAAGRLVGMVTFDDLLLALGRAVGQLAEGVRPAVEAG